MFLTAFALAATASTQTKISGADQCGKPDPHYTIQVGDRPDHASTISIVTCAFPKPVEIEGIIHKGEEVTIFGEVIGNTPSGSSWEPLYWSVTPFPQELSLTIW